MVEYTSIRTEQLQANDYNPNTMTNEEFAELVAELKHVGHCPKPIVVRGNGQAGMYTIIDGEHVWRAAREIGLTELPCEVIEADDFEAMRQTYKRNQHGRHDRVKEGLMFERMMKERSLSQREIAAEVEVSEGTVRNALEYAKAAKVRNDYAFSGLSVSQVRAYNRLPHEVGDLWLSCGANLKALYLDPHSLRQRKLESLEELMAESGVGRAEWEDGAATTIKAFGVLLELLPLLCVYRSPEGFSDAVQKLAAMDSARRLGGWHVVERAEALPYMRTLARVRWQSDKPESYGFTVQSCLRQLLRVVEGKIVAVVPAEAFAEWVKKGKWGNLAELALGIKELIAVCRPELLDQNPYKETRRIHLERDAPEFIRSADIMLDQKCDLWEAYTFWLGRGINGELLTTATGKAISSLQVYNKAMGEARELEKKGRFEEAFKLEMVWASSAHTAGDILKSVLDKLILERRAEAARLLFANKKALIEAVVEKLKETAIMRTGTIGGTPARVVMASRLAMMDMPELSLLGGYVLGEELGASQRWFNALGGEPAH